jgi:hypothetical protein
VSKDTRLHVLLTTDEREALRAKAKSLGISMGACARLAIRGFLKQGLIIPGERVIKVERGLLP